VDGSERRRHVREEARIAVDLAGMRISAHTRDMSVGGIFVEWSDPLPPGSLLPVTLHLPDGPLELTAVVVRTVEQVGMGMRFDARSDLSRKRLEVFVARARRTS